MKTWIEPDRPTIPETREPPAEERRRDETMRHIEVERSQKQGSDGRTVNTFRVIEFRVNGFIVLGTYDDRDLAFAKAAHYRSRRTD